VKKTVLIFILLVIVSVGAFADHPSGFGIGIGEGIESDYEVWNGYGMDYFQGGLSIKFPSIPIYWTVNLHRLASRGYYYEEYYSLSLTGDKYIFDRKLVPNINLNWFFGVGVRGIMPISDELSFSALLRFPVGLSWQPISLLEVFCDIAPWLSLTSFPKTGWTLEGGVRFWFGKKEKKADFYHEYNGKDIGLARQPTNLGY